jgi:uncharacterized membrane protein (UPF0127 family)
MHRPLAVLFALAALALAACSGGSAAPATPSAPAAATRARLATTTVHAGSHAIPVEVAATAPEREQGLGDRDALPRDAGMLFDMERDVSPDFWMKGMRFALDLVWIDARKKVVGVTPDVPPQPGVPDERLLRYRPPSPVRFVIEVNAGAARGLGLEDGAQVSFDLPPRTGTEAK